MAAKKTTKKKVPAKRTTTALAAGIDFSNDVGTGMEGADNDCFAIPFLRILQQLSPQCVKGEAEYNPDADPGMFINSVTGELAEEVVFLPCAFQRRFVRWEPRGAGGGFKGDFLPEQVQEMCADGRLVELDGRWYFPDEPNGPVHEKKNDLCADTRNHYGLLVDDEGNTTPVLLSLSSTQIKKSKQLMSILSNAKVNGQTPPTWMNRIKLTTVAESNDEGNWFGLRVEPDGIIDSADQYNAGKQFHAAVSKGQVKAVEPATDHKDGF